MSELQERAQDGVAERAGAAGDQQNLALEHMDSLAITTADASWKRKTTPAIPDGLAHIPAKWKPVLPAWIGAFPLARERNASN